MIFFGKSDYACHKSMLMIFLDQICIIVLHIQQVQQKNSFGQMFFFGTQFIAEVGKCTALKQPTLAGFFKGKKTIATFCEKWGPSVLCIASHKKYFIEKVVYTRLLYIPITTVCQKRKPQIQGLLLNVLHIQGPENTLQW